MQFAGIPRWIYKNGTTSAVCHRVMSCWLSCWFSWCLYFLNDLLWHKSKTFKQILTLPFAWRGKWCAGTLNLKGDTFAFWMISCWSSLIRSLKSYGFFPFVLFYVVLWNAIMSGCNKWCKLKKEKEQETKIVACFGVFVSVCVCVCAVRR